MALGLEPKTLTDAANQQAGADAAASMGNMLSGLWETGKDGVESMLSSASEAKENGVGTTIQSGSENVGKKAGKAFSKVKIPELLGGLGGVGLMWLLSSVFGGGWWGTIAFAFLAIPGFMMGRSFGQNTLSKWFGGGGNRDSQSDIDEQKLQTLAQSIARGQAQAVDKDAPADVREKMEAAAAEAANPLLKAAFDKGQAALVAAHKKTAELSNKIIDEEMRKVLPEGGTVDAATLQQAKKQAMAAAEPLIQKATQPVMAEAHATMKKTREPAIERAKEAAKEAAEQVLASAKKQALEDAVKKAKDGGVDSLNQQWSQYSKGANPAQNTPAQTAPAQNTPAQNTPPNAGQARIPSLAQYPALEKETVELYQKVEKTHRAIEDALKSGQYSAADQEKFRRLDKLLMESKSKTDAMLSAPLTADKAASYAGAVGNVNDALDHSIAKFGPLVSLVPPTPANIKPISANGANAANGTAIANAAAGLDQPAPPAKPATQSASPVQSLNSNSQQAPDNNTTNTTQTLLDSAMISEHIANSTVRLPVKTVSSNEQQIQQLANVRTPAPTAVQASLG